MSFLVGHVERYDYDAGLGEVVADGGGRWRFHCTQIADGSRRIEAGRRVVFTVAADGPGQWEARQLTNLE